MTFSNNGKNDIHKLFIDTIDGIDIILKDNICYVEYDLGLTKIYLADGKVYTLYKTLKDVVGSLDESTFVQISRNVVINALFVTRIINKNNTTFIKMSEPKDVILRCTRYNVKQLKDILQY